MNSSFYTGISAAKANSKAINIWGDNTANANTIGYKHNTANFKDLISSSAAKNGNSNVNSDLGLGTALTSTAVNTSQGSITNSDKVFDMAIQGERGFFAVRRDNIYDNNKTTFTRAGNFTRNKNGFLVNANDAYLLGNNYNNIKLKPGSNDQFFLDTQVNNKNSNVVANNQDRLLVPKRLTLPSIASTEAQLIRNLPPKNLDHAKAAGAKDRFSALLDQKATTLKMTQGQELLFAVGNQDYNFDEASNFISHELKIDSKPSDDFNFILQNKSLRLPFVASENLRGFKIRLVNFIKTNFSDMKAHQSTKGIILAAKDSLSLSNIANSNDIAKPLAVDLIQYNKSKTAIKDFSSLGDLRQKIQDTISKIYNPKAVKVRISNTGSLIVNAQDAKPVLAFKKTTNSNERLFEQLKSLNGDYDAFRVGSSAKFHIATYNNIQHIFDSNGNKRLLNTEFTQIESGFDSRWQVNVSISKQKHAEAIDDFAHVFVKNKDIRLKEGENLLLGISGKNVSRDKDFLKYRMMLPKVIKAGSIVDLDVNGKNVRLEINKDSASNEVGQILLNKMQALGIKAEASNNILDIKNDRSHKSLTVSVNENTIRGLSLEPAALMLASYSKNPKNNTEFRTFSHFVNNFNEHIRMAKIDANISFVNASIRIDNNEKDLKLKSIVSNSDNSNKHLVNLFRLSHHGIPSKGSQYTLPITVREILSQNNTEISFNNSGIATNNPQVTLDNNGKDFKLDLSKMTEYEHNVPDQYFRQNGSQASDLEHYTINNKGQINAVFLNGKSFTVGEVTLFYFANPQGLMKVGNSEFTATANSGNAFLFSDQNNNLKYVSKIKNRALEKSNVSMTEAMTQMLVFQRSFSANAKTISTSDEMLKNAIQMKR